MVIALSTVFSNITISILIAALSMQLSNTTVSSGPQAELTDRELYFSYVDEITSRDEYNFYPDIDKLVKAMMIVESDCQPDLTSSAGCIGLMQLSLYWQADRAKRLGVDDLWDPYGNILVGVDFLRDLYFNYTNQDMPLAIMMYNMDFTSARKIRASGQLTGYSVKVLSLCDELKEDNDMNTKIAVVRNDNIDYIEKFLSAKLIKTMPNGIMAFRDGNHLWYVHEGTILEKDTNGDVGFKPEGDVSVNDKEDNANAE